jgi:hypothetical protein
MQVLSAVLFGVVDVQDGGSAVYWQLLLSGLFDLLKVWVERGACKIW